MNSMTRRSLRPTLLASMTAALLALSACTINIGTGPGAVEVPVAADGSAFSAGDVMFAYMMIPHHEQALEMSVLALDRSTDTNVRDIAQRIYDGQGPEIEQMQSWISNGPSSGGMSHEMPDGTVMADDMMGGTMMDSSTMAGMASEADMTQLSALTTPEFDILFLQLMIDHHEGALAMVRMIENSSNDEAALLAQEIINAQKAEIEEMTLLLGSLSGA